MKQLSVNQCPSVNEGTYHTTGSSMANATCQPSKRRTLEAMVIAIDDAVGGVVDALRQGALWHRTLMLFLSDNGGAVGKQGSNLPLRGGKKGLFEGGVRVPAVVAGGWLPPELRGLVNEGLAHLADWCVRTRTHRHAHMCTHASAHAAGTCCATRAQRTAGTPH